MLDDCSQDRRTPEIIRSFAQHGVTFIKGTDAGDDWLAKNHAYQQLADKVNAEFTLFCGVDARFEPGSLRKMVESLIQKNKTMISIIPKNEVPSLTQSESC